MRSPLAIPIFLASLGSTGMAHAEEDCTAPMAQWQPREAVQRMARSMAGRCAG